MNETLINSYHNDKPDEFRKNLLQLDLLEFSKNEEIIHSICRTPNNENLLEVYSFLNQEFYSENDILYFCCSNNYLESAELVFMRDHTQNDIDIYEKRHKAFDISVENGNLEIAQWLYSIGSINIKKNLKRYIINCCKKGDFKMIQWLLGLDGIDAYQYLSENGFTVMKQACKVNQIDILKWIHKIIKEFLTPKKYKSLINMAAKHGSLEAVKLVWGYNKLEKRDIDYCFKIACGSDLTNLKTIEWLNSKKSQDISDDNYVVFKSAARKGIFSVVKWIYKQIKYLPKKEILVAFYLSCRYNKLEISKWIYDNFNLKKQDIGNSLFADCCIRKDISTVKWLYHDGIDINYQNDLAFRNACSVGNLDLAQWLYNLKVDIHVWKDLPFRNACLSGKFKLVKWLYNLGGINIHSEHDEAFRLSCEYNDKRISHWLYKKGGVDMHAVDEYAFRLACENGNIKLAKWLYKKGGVNIHALDEYAFRLACETGHLDLAKWLYQLNSNIDIRVLNDEAFRRSCNLRIKDIVEWLMMINNNYSYEINDDQEMIPIIKNNILEYLETKNFEQLIKKTGITKNKDLNLGQCCICYESANTITKCQHEYCLSCLVKWSLTSSKCPYCNQDFVLSKCATKVNCF